MAEIFWFGYRINVDPFPTKLKTTRKLVELTYKDIAFAEPKTVASLLNIIYFNIFNIKLAKHPTFQLRFSN